MTNDDILMTIRMLLSDEPEPARVEEVPSQGRVRRPRRFSPHSKYPIDQLEFGEVFEIPEASISKTSLESAIELARKHSTKKFGMRTKSLPDGKLYQVFRKPETE